MVPDLIKLSSYVKLWLDWVYKTGYTLYMYIAARSAGEPYQASVGNNKQNLPLTMLLVDCLVLLLFAKSINN